MVPYRAPLPLPPASDPWAGARRALLLFGVACLVSAATVPVEWVGLRLAGSGHEDDGLTLAAFAMLARAAANGAYAVSAALLWGNARRVGLSGVVLATALLLALSALVGTTQVVGMSLPAMWHPPTWLVAVRSWSSAALTLGPLALLGTAWRLENAMRIRATGWAWALACAIVVSLGVWRLHAGAPTSLDLYVAHVRRAPFGALATYVVLGLTGLCLALPALHLRRRLVGAPATAPVPPPAAVGKLQLHAACLEAKLALWSGLAMLQCTRTLGGLVGIHGLEAWGGVFFAGDLALDTIAFAALARGTFTTGAGWLLASIVLRAPVLVAPQLAGFGDLSAGVGLAVILSVVGHHMSAGWLREGLEPYCVARTREALRGATRPVVLALGGFIAANLLRSWAFLLAGPTAVVAALFLRRHVEAVLAALREADGLHDAPARPAS